MKNEIVLYQSNTLSEHIEVRVDEETVWLTQAQIAKLFGTQRQAITKHLKNIFDSGKLNPDSVSSILELTAQDGKSYKTKVYNLDAILSVGYRVNSKNATQFRIWANKILKDYLLKGYAINNRMNRLEDSVESLKSQVNEIDLQINTHLIPTQGVFFNGQVFDAYELASKIIRSAKSSIILIDNYIDETTITHLTKKKKNVKVLLLTQKISKQLTLDIEKANQQYAPSGRAMIGNDLTTAIPPPTLYGGFTAKQFSHSHDRFLIIDEDKDVYHIGASLKDLGKKWFAFSKMDSISVAGIMKAVSGLI